MKKSGQQTYLNEEEKSLVIALAKIEGGHGLTSDCRGIANKLHNIVKSANPWYGDNNILEKSSMRYFR